ncbi:hypothetical protein MMC30_008643 [Trapelia coarctata]|nr:hypothetical protein [Trapelia coarctata]
MAQPGYPQYRNPMPMQQQQNVHPAQHSNPYAFNTNAQYTGMGAPGSAVPPAPPPLFQYPGYGQYTPSGPPTSFPPASFPNHNLQTQRIAASVPLPPSPQVFHAPTSLPPKPIPPAGHPVGGVTNPHQSGASFAGGSRESVEQSELGLHRAVNGAVLGTSTTQQGSSTNNVNRLPAHQDIPPQADANTAYHREVQPPESDGLENSRKGSSGDQALPKFHSSAAGPPEVSLQVNGTNPAPGVSAVNTSVTPSLVNGGKSLSEVLQKNIDPPTARVSQPTRPYSDNTLPQYTNSNNNSDYQRASLREEVKGALQNLYRQNIGFESLSAEGVNVSLLRELYQELGIQVSEINIPKTGQDSSQNPTTKPSSINHSTTVAVNLPESLESRSEVPTSARLVGADEIPAKTVVQPKTASDIPREHYSPGRGLPELQKESEVTSVAVLLSQVGKAKTSTWQKTKSAPSAEDRALERKDYIAKMLAAKVGKGAASKALKPTETVKLDVQVDNEKSATDISLQPAPMNIISPDVKLDQTNIQAEFEAKKKASTELARRKMEALMTQAHEPHGPSAAKTLSESPRSSQEAQIRPASGPSLPTQTIITHQLVEVAPVSSTQQYTPETPFFAPLEQRPMIGLPGLSMSYPLISAPYVRPPSVALSKDINPNEVSSSSVETQSATALNDNHSSAVNTPTLNPEPRLPQVASVTNVEVASTPLPKAEAMMSSRKRATASDFIDFRSDKAKVRVGPDGPYKLVIGDVSDDEGDFDEDAMDVDEASEPPESEPPQLEKATTHNNKTMRDLPPLSNIPAWSKVGIASSASTPPLVQTPGRSSEAEDLARAEEQIRKLKQMIAEKEERKKAKLYSSRGQSPGGLTNASSMNAAPTPKTSPESASKVVLTAEKKEQELATVRHDLEVQKIALVAAEKEMQINLDAEKQVQASVVAKAEQERQEAARATTTAEREYRERRKATLEAALPELDAQIEKAMLKLDEMHKQKEELEAEIQRGSEGRKKILQELNALLTELEIENSAPSGPEMQRDTPGEDSRPGSRPVVDPSKGLRDGSESNGRATSPPSIQTVSPVSSIPNTARPITPASRQLSRPESPDEIMEISSDSSDEGEIDNPDPEISPNQQLRPDSEMDNDEYEPQLDTDILVQQMPDRVASADVAVHPSRGMAAPNSMQVDQGNVDHTADTPSVDRSSIEEGELSRSMSADDGGDSDDYEPPEPVPIVDNTAASDESEAFRSKPPSSHEEEWQIPPESSTAVVGPSTVVDLTGDMSTDSNDAPLENHSNTATTLKQTGHFTPYESPLKTFHSYRYHPKYVSDVPGGFRSLTYSHNLNPNEPLCRWELAGGTCNDGSCNYQHFRSMPLTDDKILVQLGSIREGDTREEQKKYVSGLKQMIYDMRSKHITDLELVVKGIAAYRSSFLGDSSRVLTHITP